MDKLIEMLAVNWVDWRQLAIENMYFVALLGGLSFLLGMLVVSILKAFKIAGLNRRLSEEQSAIKQLNEQQENYLNQQQQDQEKLAALQQQLDTAANDLEQTKATHQSSLESKEQTLNEKDAEVKKLNVQISEQSQQSEHLQTELDTYKEQTAQLTTLQNELAESKQKESMISAELSEVQKQLVTEMNEKALLAEQLESFKESAKSDQEKVSEQAFEPTPSADVEEPMQPATEKQVAEETENINAEPIIDTETQPVDTTEQDVALKKESTSETKGMMDAVSEWFSSEDKDQRNEESAAESVDSGIGKSIESAEVEEVTAEPAFSQAENPATPEMDNQENNDEAKSEKTGMVSGVLNWFNKLDDKLLAKPKVDQEDPDISTPSSDEETVELNQASTSSTEAKPTIKEAKEAEENEPVDMDNSFSEKLSGFADKMESYNAKFKGMFGSKKE